MPPQRGRVAPAVPVPWWRDPALPLFGSGRAALAWLCATQVPPGARMLCPALICPAVLQAMAAGGARPVFYPVDGQLRPQWAALDAAGCDAMLLWHPLGRPLAPAAIAALRRRHPRLVLIEDRSHTLLNGFRAGQADFAFASLRKLLPVPDGGVALAPRGATAAPSPSPVPSPAAVRRLAAEALWDAGRTRSAELLAAMAEEALDAALPEGPISRVSLDLLARCDPVALRRSRRARYRMIAAALRELPGVRLLWGDLPRGVAPLAVPLLCRNRHDLRRALCAEGVLAAPFWPVPESAREAAGVEGRLLAGSLLLVPCDPFARLSLIRRALANVRARHQADR